MAISTNNNNNRLKIRMTYRMWWRGSGSTGMSRSLASLERRRTLHLRWWTSLRHRLNSRNNSKIKHSLLRSILRRFKCRWTWCNSKCFFYSNNPKWWPWTGTKTVSANWPNKCSNCKPCRWTSSNKWVFQHLSKIMRMMTIVSWMKTCQIWRLKSKLLTISKIFKQQMSQVLKCRTVVDFRWKDKDRNRRGTEWLERQRTVQIRVSSAHIS